MSTPLSRLVFLAALTVAVTVGSNFAADPPYYSAYPQGPPRGTTASTTTAAAAADIKAVADEPCRANEKETTHFCCTGNESDSCFCFDQHGLTIRTSTSLLIWVLVLLAVLLILVSCGCGYCWAHGVRNAYD